MSWSFGLDFGAGLGALVGGAFSGVSARRQFEYQSALQRQAAQLNYDYSIKSAENMPFSTRKGLVSAGYNPMLAVQNGTSGANASFTNAGNAVAPDYSGGMSAGLGNVLQIQNMKNQTSQTESINDKNYAEADEAKVRKQSLLQKLPFISQREKTEISNIEKDSLLKEAQVHNIDETTRFIEKDFELRKRLGEMGIDVQRYGINKNFAGVVYNADTLYDIANEHQPSGSSSSFKNYAGGARDIMSGIGDIIHGRSDTYENYDESVQHSSRDKKTGVTTTTKSRKTGRRKK